MRIRSGPDSFFYFFYKNDKNHWTKQNIAYNKKHGTKNIKTIKKAKRLWKETAVAFGDFCPSPSRAYLIQRAKLSVTRFKDVVNRYEGDRESRQVWESSKTISLYQRGFSWWRIDSSVRKLDETNLPRYPMGWQEWLDQMLGGRISSWWKTQW